VQDSLTAAVVAGLGGMLGWGLADLFAKKTIDWIGDVRTLVWAHVAGSSVALCLLLWGSISAANNRAPRTAVEWTVLGAFGVLQAVIYLLVYRGFAKGQVATLAPLFASFSALVAIVSITALGEPATMSLILGLTVIFAGVLVLNVDPGALRGRRLKLAKVPGVPEVGAATLLATIWTIGWNLLVKGRDPLLSSGIMYGAMTLALLLYAAARVRPLGVGHVGAWKYLLLIGVCEVVAYASVTRGYGSSPHTSIVAIVSGAFSLPTIILARPLLGERIGRLRAAASFAIVAGIALLNLA